MEVRGRCRQGLGNQELERLPEKSDKLDFDPSEPRKVLSDYGNELKRAAFGASGSGLSASSGGRMAVTLTRRLLAWPR